MTFAAAILFALALFASVGTIWLTVRNAMPRIREVVDMEFAPAIQAERKIIFGPMKTTRRPLAAEIVAFPRPELVGEQYRLAA